MTGDNARPDRGAQPVPAPPFDAARLIETNQRAMNAALAVQSHGFRQMARIGTSVIEFVQRRLQHDAELAQRLGTSKAPQEAYTACHDFMDVAVREYSHEFSELATLYVDQTREAIQDAERQLEESARPLKAAE